MSRSASVLLKDTCRLLPVISAKLRLYALRFMRSVLGGQQERAPERHVDVSIEFPEGGAGGSRSRNEDEIHSRRDVTKVGAHRLAQAPPDTVSRHGVADALGRNEPAPAVRECVGFYDEPNGVRRPRSALRQYGGKVPLFLDLLRLVQSSCGVCAGGANLQRFSREHSQSGDRPKLRADREGFLEAEQAQTVRRVRCLTRRCLMMRRPARVAMRARKPCLRDRRRTFG